MEGPQGKLGCGVAILQAPWMRFCKTSCLSLEMYLLPIECEATVTVCKAHNESSCAQEICSSPGITICRHLECDSTSNK